MCVFYNNGASATDRYKSFWKGSIWRPQWWLSLSVCSAPLWTELIEFALVVMYFLLLSWLKWLILSLSFVSVYVLAENVLVDALPPSSWCTADYHCYHFPFLLPLLLWLLLPFYNASQTGHHGSAAAAVWITRSDGQSVANSNSRAFSIYFPLPATRTATTTTSITTVLVHSLSLFLNWTTSCNGAFICHNLSSK